MPFKAVSFRFKPFWAKFRVLNYNFFLKRGNYMVKS